MKQVINVPHLTEYNRERGVPLSPAIRANGLLFLSGIGPLDIPSGTTIQGDIREQTEASIDALQYVLQAAGSCLDQVVNTRIYVTNSGHYDAINDVYARRFAVDPPARTFVTVASWFGGFDIEIEAVALDPTN